MLVTDQPLRGMEAMESLQRLLQADWAGQQPTFADAPPARLAAAVSALRMRCGPVPSPLDLAVLVRHLLRWCAESAEMAGIGTDLLVPRSPGWPSQEQWELVGVQAEERAQGYRVTARPWMPAWLPDVPPDGVDGRAAGAPQRRLIDPVPADPFLTRDFSDRRTYRSAGQRTAVRASLLAPPGSTLLVGLPTGDGKSLIFQVLARTGFPLQGEHGLVLVVTPTVALALDHQETARALALAEEPLAYQGGDTTGANQQILERVESGTQRILFTSPEAICRGPLGRAITRAAEKGHLAALVIDEAHLIETWGKEFRPDFQTLAGIRTTLLGVNKVAPFRTILLSATITEQTVETVRTLFGKGPDGRESFHLFAANYLRPEIEFWVKEPLADSVRESSVVEALCHVPRPAILYVTTIDDANRWMETCWRVGFQRIGMMTGETPSDERERVIRAWKSGQLDLVVGNAAFGLGIDKSDVRAVIHACVPESLDRFYQEVGRGGRDGRAALSLLLPTPQDVSTARSMQAKHIGVEKGYGRWEAMFLRHRIPEPDTDTHLVWVDAPPGGGANRLDFRGKGNTLWNLNTLTLMATSGLVELEALVSLPVDVRGKVVTVPDGEVAEYRAYQRIRLPQGPILNEAEWERLVQPFRLASFRAQQASVDAMLSLWNTGECLSEHFVPVYTLPGHEVTVARHCGGCPACRRRGVSPTAETVRESPWPWPPARLSGVGAALVDEQNRALIYYETADLPTTERKWERMFKAIAAVLRRSGIHSVIVPAGSPFRADLLQRYCEGWPLFISDALLLPKLPPGPSLVFLPEGTEVAQSLLGPRRPEDARLYVVHEGVADPCTEGSRLIDRHSGRTLSFDQFKRQVEQ